MDLLVGYGEDKGLVECIYKNQANATNG